MATKHMSAAKRKAGSHKPKPKKAVNKKKPAPKKKKKSGGFHMSGKSSSFKGRGLHKKAANRVDGQLRQLISQLNNEGAGVRRERNYQIGLADDLLERSRGDLDYIYGEVADTQKAQDAKIAEGYAQTGAKVQELQQALQGQMADTSATNKQAAMDELARLGIQQTGTGRFDADASYAQQLAQQSGANTNANLATSQAMSAEIGAMLQSMAAGQHQSNVGTAVNQHQASVSQLSHTANEQLMDLIDEGKEARAGRGAAINELFDQLYNTRFNQWATTRDMNFNQRLAAMQFNQSEAQRKRENAMAAAAARRAARGSSGGGGGGHGTSYSSSGYGSNHYTPKPKPKKPNPVRKLIPRRPRKLKNTVTSGYTPSGKFIDIR